MGRKDIKQKMNQTQTAMQIFEYQGNEVRTIQHGDEVWWVLKDVCRVLSLSTPHKVAERLEEDERNLIPLIDSMGRTQKNTIVNEPGLYSVILRSDKPEAKTFKRWVTHEVLPSIRKTGAYNVGQELTDEEKMAHGLIAANAILQRQLKKKAMRSFMKEVPISVEAIDNGFIFDIIVALYHSADSAVVRICRYHTNIVFIQKNSDILLDNTAAESKPACGGDNPAEDDLSDRNLLTIADIFDFANTCDTADVCPVLDTQIQYNTQISEEGLLGDYGANIGSTMLKFYGDDVRNRAIAKAAAGSDARMSGCELPVVINSGSGNQGITVSVPVIEYAKALAVPKDRLYRALALSNLIAIHEKTGIGRLSTYCGAVSAGCAAGCGIAYLQGADLKAISHTLVNSLAIVSGIICDGAKPSCAAKIASSVQAGIMGYHMYQNGQQFRGGDGIVTKGVENTIRNVSQLGREGMRETDKEIVKIMLQES